MAGPSEGAEESGSMGLYNWPAFKTLFIDDYRELFYPTHIHAHLSIYDIYIYTYKPLSLSMYVRDVM